MEANLTAIRNLVRYHVVEGMVESENISTSSPLHTMTTAEISVSSAGNMEDSQGGTADILAADMVSSNGLVHAISGVMLPFPEEYLGVSGDGEGGSDGDDDGDGRNVEVAAITAGVCAAVILVLAAFAVQKRRQAEAARPPQVAPDEAGWVGAGRPAPIHPA